MERFDIIIITFTELFPLVLTEMVRSIKRWQHTLLYLIRSHKPGYKITLEKKKRKER